MATDYYELLEVERTADETTIKKSYRRLAIKYHPDRNQGNPEAAEKFKAVSSAYEVLSNPEKRALYDRYGEDAFKHGGGGGGGADPFDIFSSFFGGGGGGGAAEDIFGSFFGGGQRRRRSPNAPTDGDDLRYELHISFEESVFGADKTIEFSRMDACPACHGSGCADGSSMRTCRRCGGTGQVGVSQGFFTVMQTCPECSGHGSVPEKRCNQCSGRGVQKVRRSVHIHIPPGVDTGNRLRVQGEGAPGLRGGRNGDLYVEMSVGESELFHRENENLFCEIPVDFPTAALGGKIEVPTISGKTEFEIPPGTQTGDTFNISGKGMPSVRGNGRGNLYIRVLVEVPKRLSDKQKDALRAYGALFADKSERTDAHPKFKEFLDKAKRFFGV